MPTNVVASVFRSANQTIADTQYTAISFDHAVFQTSTLKVPGPGSGNVWNASHPTRLTIPPDVGVGLYQVGYVLTWEGSLQGALRLAEIRRNGKQTPAYGRSAVPLNGALLSTSLTGSALLELQSGDYVELFGLHTELPAASWNAVGGETTLNFWLARITFE